MIISEFYGHVRRMINHPEGSWILDDIYRQVANKNQKARLLREWYDSEYAIFKKNDYKKVTATLSDILAETPEKRKPIMSHLYNLINQLVQKKLTGFTMLHEAMLQYYLNCKPGSEEATEFLELLKGQGDEEEKDHDLLKNLAFTSSGSRVVCMALAYGTAKDRRQILKVYKDMVETLSYDAHGHCVLLTAFDVIDDTVATGRAIFPELLGKSDEDSQEQDETIIAQVVHPTARTVLLYTFASTTATSALPKSLLSKADMESLRAIHEIRQTSTTSKKDPKVRRQELVRSVSPRLLAFISRQAMTLAKTSFGCQFMTEVLLAAEGDRTAALGAVAHLATGNLNDEAHISRSSFAVRMLKTLVQGGHFDPQQKAVRQAQPSAEFCSMLFASIDDVLLQWTMSPGAFVVLALLEQNDWKGRDRLIKTLQNEKPTLEEAITTVASAAADAAQEDDKDSQKNGQRPALAGMKLLLQQLE